MKDSAWIFLTACVIGSFLLIVSDKIIERDIKIEQIRKGQFISHEIEHKEAVQLTEEENEFLKGENQ